MPCIFSTGAGRCTAHMKVNIYVIPYKKSVDLLLRDTDTVRTVKKKLQDKLDFPFSVQKLIYAGQELKDECNLAEYNIQRDSTLQLAGRKLYGCVCMCYVFVLCVCVCVYFLFQ